MPVITAIEGSPPVEEGATVAVLVTGTNFVPGASYVSVPAERRGRQPDRPARRGHAGRDEARHDDPGRPDPGAARTTPGGPGAAVGPHAPGADAGGHADIPFPIAGRDEIRVRPGRWCHRRAGPVVAPRRGPGGRLDVASTVPPVTIDVLGQAEIWGDVAGGPGNGRPAARPPNRLARSGRGGRRRRRALQRRRRGRRRTGRADRGRHRQRPTMGATGSAGLGARPGTIGRRRRRGSGSQLGRVGAVPARRRARVPRRARAEPAHRRRRRPRRTLRVRPRRRRRRGRGRRRRGPARPRPAGRWRRGRGRGGRGRPDRRGPGAVGLRQRGRARRRRRPRRPGLRRLLDPRRQRRERRRRRRGAIHVSRALRGQGAWSRRPARRRARNGRRRRSRPGPRSRSRSTARRPARSASTDSPWRRAGRRPCRGRTSSTRAARRDRPAFEVRGLDANYIAVTNGEDDGDHPIARGARLPPLLHAPNRSSSGPCRCGRASTTSARSAGWKTDPFPMEINALLMESAGVRVRRVSTCRTRSRRTSSRELAPAALPCRRSARRTSPRP